MRESAVERCIGICGHPYSRPGREEHEGSCRFVVILIVVQEGRNMKVAVASVLRAAE